MTAHSCSSPAQINFHCLRNYEVSKSCFICFGRECQEDNGKFLALVISQDFFSVVSLPDDGRREIGMEKGRLLAPGDFFMKEI